MNFSISSDGSDYILADDRGDEGSVLLTSGHVRSLIPALESRLQSGYRVSGITAEIVDGCLYIDDENQWFGIDDEHIPELVAALKGVC